MKIAYLDCPSGIAGDMLLGALVDAGVDLTVLQAGVDSLGLPSCQLVREEVKRGGFRATKIHVMHEPEHAHRHLHHITEMIDRAAAITPAQKELAKRIFTRLGEAEAKVHGTTIRKVHFHEVGAVDSIADIVGGAIGLDLLGVDRIVCSPPALGSGYITIAHGRVSVPAPATAELLLNVPLGSSPVEAELTTPTGAAIVSTIADSYGPLPAMTLHAIGYGAGTKDFKEQPNVVRLMLGETSESLVSDQIWVLETNLDDISGEMIGHCATLLAEAGALDVYTASIHMKKNRPGVLLSVLAPPELVTKLEKIIFRETATLGIRRWPVSRHKLERRPVTVETAWGPVLGKLAILGDGTASFSPEYEACRIIATQQAVSLKEVYEAARTSYKGSEH
ncbi:MAG TPA: nickel pincer cofactor biosynthesis protein LarC [Pirellulaceae bacterium]|nr:nickel pincer cofactor biosynthesis protein LarC [Pirellulaceae bacterium]